jgi:hypothetical protein
MPRPLCGMCGNTGQMIEYRLMWKEPREGKTPQQFTRRVESAADGLERMKELGPEAFEKGVVSGARACPCRRVASPPAAARVKPGPIGIVDWKMRQAGNGI